MPETSYINYNALPEAEKQKLQRVFHEDDLNYFTSFSFEANAISPADINDLNKTIDKRAGKTPPSGRLNLFIALAIGIFIGCSLFFIYHQNKLTPSSKNQPISELDKNNFEAPLTTIDTVTAIITKKQPEPVEHFVSGAINETHIEHTEMEDMAIKEIAELEVKEPQLSEEVNFVYIPNASVIFIHDLKVADYLKYYFKDNRNIDIRDNGLSPRYSNKEEAAPSLSSKAEDRNYYAHEIIKDALYAFHKKQYSLSIELLELLRRYNKDDVNAQFYTGMSYYILGDYKNALYYLSKAEENRINIFLQETEFYKALCYAKSGKTGEAKTLLTQIKNKKLFYSKRAAEELSVLP